MIHIHWYRNRVVIKRDKSKFEMKQIQARAVIESKWKKKPVFGYHGKRVGRRRQRAGNLHAHTTIIHFQMIN